MSSWAYELTKTWINKNCRNKTMHQAVTKQTSI